MNDVDEITPQPIVITELRCLRCGGTWIPRKAKMPGYCPKCNSPYWNKPRRVKKSEKKDENRIYPPYLCCVAEKRYEKDKDTV